MAEERSGGSERPTPVEDQPPDAGERRNLRTAAWGGLVGTALEQYDFVIYGTASAIIFNRIFFPDVEPAIGILASFATYAVGFLARPLGGLFFSRYGDKLGRKFVLVATLFLMGIATFLIGALPTYDQVGLLAPLLLVLLRLLQGFGAGAEQAGGIVLLTETAPKGRRGRYASLVYVGASAGTALGAIAWLVVQFLPDDHLDSYGWRLVFFSSFFVTVAAYILRIRLQEAPVFRRAKEEKKTEGDRPIRTVLTKGRRPFSRGFFINLGGNTQSYIVQVFLGSYLIETIGTSEELVPQVLFVGALAGCVSAFAAGRLTDAFGRKPVVVGVAISLVVFPVPAFLLLGTANVVLIYLVIVAGFVLAAYGTVGSQAAMLPELFGSRYRYAGVALAREFSAVLGGGVAPLVCSALITWALGSWWPVAVYMMAVAAITLVAALRTPETRDRDLVTTDDAL